MAAMAGTERGARAGGLFASAVLGSLAMLPFGPGQAAGEFTDVAGAYQLVQARVTRWRQGPVIACCAATPDPPLRVLAPEPLQLGILVARAGAGGHRGRGLGAAQVTGG